MTFICEKCYMNTFIFNSGQMSNRCVYLALAWFYFFWVTTVPRIHHVENVVCKVNFSLFPAMPWKQREDFFPFASSRSWSHLRVFSPASPLWSQSCPFTFSLSSLCLGLDLIVYASCSCLISLIPFCCVFSHVSPLFLITSLCMYCLFSEHQSSSPWVCQL